MLEKLNIFVGYEKLRETTVHWWHRLKVIENKKGAVQKDAVAPEFVLIIIKI